jgi:hypothetical protein
MFFKSQTRIAVLGGLLWACTLAGQTNALNRNYEPVIIQGNTVSEFLTVPYHDLFVYRFISSTNTWEQIPFQFDDVGADEAYFSETDGTLDGNDELVFMAHDAGDQAGIGNWVDDADSKQYRRYELKISDPTDAERSAWVYLYRSATLSYTSSEDYISVNSASDEISTAYYQIGHNANGMLDRLQISTSGGGNNADIVDREKFRICGAIAFITYEVCEDHLATYDRLYKDGPVRVLRQQTYQFVMPGLDYHISLSERFYERMSLTGGGIGQLDAQYGVNYLRQSLDLNSLASGMLFYNPLNSGIVIDGHTDTPNSILPSSGWTWAMLTGTQGTIFQALQLPAIGNPQNMYYNDNSAGGTTDGTNDTGDDQSWGDIGVSFTHPSLGQFTLGFARYYLPANQSGTAAAQLAQDFTNPMTLTATGQVAPCDGELSARITNPRIDNNCFCWDVEIKRTNDWGSSTNEVLGDSRFSFSVNRDGFTDDDPSVTNLAANLVGNANYQYQTGRANDDHQAYLILSHESDAGGSDWYPPLDTWVRLFTISLPIQDNSVLSNLAWSAAASEALTAQPATLELTLSGSEDIQLPVELQAFWSKPENGMLALYWETASESKNLGFHIFRSNDREGVYQKVNATLVWGAGQSENERLYRYVDRSARVGQTYYYKIADVDYSGLSTMHGPYETSYGQPTDYILEQNFPNPFNPETTIHFTLKEAGEVYMNIYNIRGELVRHLLDGEHRSGRQVVQWNGLNDQGMAVPSGTYFYELRVNDFSMRRKMVLMR